MDAGQLQSIRNTFGPLWLVRFKLSERLESKADMDDFEERLASMRVDVD